MSQSTSPHGGRRIESHTVTEGDRIALGIQLHGGVTDDYPGLTYDRDMHRVLATGDVVEAPSEADRELLADGEPVMADVVVETDDGTRYRWCIDNGYVLGPHPELGRRSDIGKISGLYEPA